MTTSAQALCPDCKHAHAGPSLAGICVGCPCETRVAAVIVKHAIADRITVQYDEDGSVEAWIEGFESVAEDEHNDAHEGAMRFCSNQVCRYVVTS